MKSAVVIPVSVLVLLCLAAVFIFLNLSGTSVSEAERLTGLKLPDHYQTEEDSRNHPSLSRRRGYRALVLVSPLFAEMASSCEMEGFHHYDFRSDGDLLIWNDVLLRSHINRDLPLCIRHSGEHDIRTLVVNGSRLLYLHFDL